MNDLATTILGTLAVLVAAALAVLEALPIIQDALLGAGAGAIVGRLVIRYRERGGRELDAREVRRIEGAWTMALGGAATLTSVIFERFA